MFVKSRSIFPVKHLCIGLALLGFTVLATAAEAQIVAAPNPFYWTPVKDGGVPLVDPNTDSQTGTNEGEFVGDANNPTFFSYFDRGNISNLTDGTLYYRVRLGSDQANNGFTGIMYLYTDANADGIVDIAIGVNIVNNQKQNVGIFGVASGLTPAGPQSTGDIIDLTGTTINGQSYAYAQASNANIFNFSPVYSSSLDLDPGDGDNVENLDGVANEPDYYLSFAVPFADVTSYLATVKSISINENTKLGYVLSSGQSNTLNQDLSPGLNGGILDFTDPTAPVAFSLPEPSSLSIVGIGALLGGGFLVRRQRRQR